MNFLHHAFKISYFALCILLTSIVILAGCGDKKNALKTIEFKITSEPLGATVIVDGTEMGITPHSGRISVGKSHHLTVSKLGYKAGTTEFNISKGSFVRHFLLEKVDLSNMVLVPAGKFLMGSSDEEARQVIRQLGGGEVTEDIQWFWEGSSPKPVGSYPQGVSPHGVYDMAGNVWEWVDSWYEAYPGSTYTTPEFGKKFRVTRGGSWYHYDSL